jgi:hypothetical protein
MLNLISGISLFLMSLLASAADQSGVVDTSVSKSAVVGIIIFGLIFFAVIVGYFGYLYWGRKKSQGGNKAQKP